jgi:hypothetical protein
MSTSFQASYGSNPQRRSQGRRASGEGNRAEPGGAPDRGGGK